MLRVAAYCRVSTDREDQANSFESQQSYFREYIGRNPQWELAEIFADEGISGTGTKKRKEFNRMIEAARAGQLDLILTKEVSRFARNTVDTLQYTRDLKRLGVFVFFMNDNIHTKDPEAELRLTIMASVAQEESRRTSERVKWGQRRRMEQGVVFGRDLLGYRVQGGRLTIDREEAETVRLIFQKFLEEGKGTSAIAGELAREGIRTALHMKSWSGVAVLRILRNEKYCGDLIQKKTYTPDYLSHEKKYNRGAEEKVVLRDHHEAIISRETFLRAQEELGRRAALRQGKGRYSSRYELSGKLVCGVCGAAMAARRKVRQDGSVYLAWRCYGAVSRRMGEIDCSERSGREECPDITGGNDSRGEKKGCLNSRQIGDQAVRELLIRVVNQMDSAQKERLETMLSDMQTAKESGEKETYMIGRQHSRLRTLERKKKRLLELYLDEAMEKAEYYRLLRQYEEEERTLRDMLQRLERVPERKRPEGQSEPEQARPEESEAQRLESKQPESEQARPEQSEAERPESKQPEPEQVRPEQSEAERSESNQPEPEQREGQSAQTAAKKAKTGLNEITEICRAVLEKVVVYDREHMEIYLRQFPGKWVCILSESVIYWTQ